MKYGIATSMAPTISNILTLNIKYEKTKSASPRQKSTSTFCYVIDFDNNVIWMVLLENAGLYSPE
jgi:hypothetical protein